MNEPVSPEPTKGHHAAITILRISLWLLPSALVAMFIGNIRHAAIHGVYLVLMCIAALSILGYLDQMLRLIQMRVEVRAGKEAAAFGTVMFVIIQFVITPFVSAALFFGMCLAKGFSY